MTSSAPSRPAPPDGRQKPAWRGWIHLVAFVVTLVVGPFLIARGPTTADKVALSIYVVSIAALFGISAAFHRINWSPPARRRMRRADHTTIFFAIAGSYTAIAVLALHGWARTLILCLVWGGAIFGVAVRQLWLDAPNWAIAIPYVVVGWSALVVVPQLLAGLGGLGFALLVLGGLFYTVGALTYARKRPDPWPATFGYHEIFHACTVLGAATHFVVIAFFALP
jgi:hemolysin III